MSARPDGRFDHRVAVHGSDDEFLAAAVPFLVEGMAAEDEPPPLLITSTAKIDLVRAALGTDRDRVSYVPSSEWYTGSAANALARAAGYVATTAGPGGRMHAIAEPDWSARPGRTERESAEWVRYEAMLNVLLAPLAMNVICPYDTRTTSPEIVEAGRRTHPTEMVGGSRQVSTSYENPLALIAKLDAAPMVERPADARSMEFHGDIAAVCGFVRAEASSHGLSEVEAGVFESAVAEVAHFAQEGVVYTWPVSAASVCELVSPSGRLDDLLIGFRPLDALEPQPGQGLWFTRQVCDYVDVRSGADGWVVRMQSASAS